MNYIHKKERKAFGCCSFTIAQQISAVVMSIYIPPYFFCSTHRTGTEGIRPVANFVPFLASYSDFRNHKKYYFNYFGYIENSYVPQITSSVLVLG